MSAGASVPLSRKLGIRPGARVALIGAPAGFVATLGPLPHGAVIQADPTEQADIILLFATARSHLCEQLPVALRALDPNGGLWIAWPRRASGMASDLTDSVVREIGLAAGVVDNKVCAIDGVWSGLRFVVRLIDRPGWPRPQAPDAG